MGIEKKDARGKIWILVNKDSLEPVDRDLKLVSRDGDWYALRGGTPPHKPNSSGRVEVAVDGLDSPQYWQEYFPHVFDLMWVRKDMLKKENGPESQDK
jgi:hypothetical protein